MPITPDTKDWTWVLERPCAECGFDAATGSPTEVPELIRRNAAAWPAVLDRPEVQRRPNGSTWSPLEYSAHVRDVFRLARIRLSLMLDEPDPMFANWDQDETAETERYNEQDPAVVAVDLVDEAELLAKELAAVEEEQWTRRGRRSDGAVFTVASFAVYIVHDPIHHLWDVTDRRET